MTNSDKKCLDTSFLGESGNCIGVFGLLIAYVYFLLDWPFDSYLFVFSAFLKEQLALIIHLIGSLHLIDCGWGITFHGQTLHIWRPCSRIRKAVETYVISRFLFLLSCCIWYNAESLCLHWEDTYSKGNIQWELYKLCTVQSSKVGHLSGKGKDEVNTAESVLTLVFLSVQWVQIMTLQSFSV